MKAALTIGEGYVLTGRGGGGYVPLLAYLLPTWNVEELWLFTSINPSCMRSYPFLNYSRQ